MLCFLCEMLEKSLFAENAELTLKLSEVEKGQKTWAAGFGQKERQNGNMFETIIQQNVCGIDNMGIIHEEEHEQQIGEKYEKEMYLENDKVFSQYYLPIEESEGIVLYEEPEPTYIRIIPQLAMLAFLIVYMFLGSLIYRLIDPEIEKKSWARSFIWVFELLATIGWGDSQAGNTSSQAFTIFYIVLGIPMLFSVYANLGRLVTSFCCNYWPIIIAKIFVKENNVVDDLDSLKTQRLPLASILTLLVIHQCIGLVIYSFWIKDLPIISTIYFSITTMATSGFGDYHPDTDSWPETLIAILYISVGIVLLSALFLTIALYYQTFLYIQLKGTLVQLYDKYLFWKRRSKVHNVEINTETVEKGVSSKT
ncbi:Ion_trans_2 domain-containing protein [Meloidogyne graminicola]|uniref:Ion_trans_2 domain-containing protein n=1 Tax=Meloidogyne graminicola TaxID=189291 RepID=A0A8T0A583_9BILA|nr:Ion_trans_2 domain-containing protein [Meloidogyne graminicola]